jgi:subtilisin family serine protease
MMIFILALLLFAAPAPAALPEQPQPYWVFLDKSGADLSDAVRERTVLEQLAGTGFRKRFESRWLNAVSGDVTAEVLARVQQFPFVKSVMMVGCARKITPPSPMAMAKTAYLRDPVYGLSYDALNLMRVPALDSLGIIRRSSAGKGVRIALFDSGFRTTHEVFRHFTDSTILAKRDYVAHIVNPAIPFDTSVADDSLDYPGQDSHGTEVLSLIAAYNPGTLMGVAPFAQFALVKTERVKDLSGHETETVQEEDAWAAAVEWVVDSVGVDIITTSLGYRYGFTDGRPDYPIDSLTGHTLLITRMANHAAGKGVIVFASVGNEGDSGASSLSAPADGDSVVAVGATEVFGVIWTHTSYGPTFDGKPKPDLSAPGSGIYYATGLNGYSLPPGGSGTSFAAPMAAGVCALLLQSVDSLKGKPMETAARLKRTAWFPSNIPENERLDPRYGTGIVNLYYALRDSRTEIPFSPPPFTFRVAPQPGRRDGLISFLLNVPNEAGYRTQDIRCKIKIYSLSGKLVMILEKQWPDLSVGLNRITWKPVSGSNKTLGSGVYMVLADYSDYNQTLSWKEKLAIVP